MTELASSLRRKMAERPRRTLGDAELRASAKALLFAMPDALAALENIQVAACDHAIELKRRRQRLVRLADPTADGPPPAAPLPPDAWERLGVPADTAAALAAALAARPADALLQHCAALHPPPAMLGPDLLGDLLRYSVRHGLAQLARSGLQALSAIADADEAPSPDALHGPVAALLAQLQSITIEADGMAEICSAFPELPPKTARACWDSVRPALAADYAAMLVILREAYYALEPVLTACE